MEQLTDDPTTWRDLRRFDMSVAPEEVRRLDGCVVCVLFSASWCPPCQSFLPRFKSALGEAQASASGALRVVCVSSDRDDDQQAAHARKLHPQWLHLPLGCPLAEALKVRHGVWAASERVPGVRRAGIPGLVVLSPSGRKIEDDGVAAVRAGGAAAVRRWLAAATAERPEKEDGKAAAPACDS